MTARDEATGALTWCVECSKWTEIHPLIHLIHRHAPRLGDRRNGQRNWRTGTLTEQSPVTVRRAA